METLQKWPGHDNGPPDLAHSVPDPAFAENPPPAYS